MVSRACSSAMPLWARRRVYSSANCSCSSESFVEMIAVSPRSTPSSAARARMLRSSPRIVSRAMPRATTSPAARRMRSSPPSGSTMWRCWARARSSSEYSKRTGVKTAVGARLSALTSASEST